MKCAEPTVIDERVATPEQDRAAQENKDVITFPLGLLGFEKSKHYQLLGSPEEAPFLWLQMVDEPNVAFLVVSPAAVCESYHPELSEEDTRALELENPQDAWVFNIVTVHGDRKATVNLKGPVVVNRRTLIGRQVIPLNVTDYPLQHPLECPAR